MKVILCTAFLLLSVSFAQAQESFKIFTSRTGEEIDEEYATQINVYEKTAANRWFCTVYDIQSKYRLTEYTCSSVQPEIRDGVVKTYWKGDTLLTEYVIINGARNGPYKSYYLNGQLEAEGLYEDGEKEGQWKYYYPAGQLLGRVTYRNHEKIQWQYFTEDGKLIKRPFEDAAPEFPGGMHGFYTYMESMPYPQVMLEKNISGIVEIMFLIDSAGNVETPSILFSSDTAFSIAVLQAIKNMPTWRPGYRHSRTVNTLMRVPFAFRAAPNDDYKTLAEELVNSGKQAFGQNNYENAYKYFKEAVYLDPFNNKTILSLAITALNLGKVDEACRCTEYLIVFKDMKEAERYLKYCDWVRYEGMPIPTGIQVPIP